MWEQERETGTCLKGDASWRRFEDGPGGEEGPATSEVRPGGDEGPAMFPSRERDLYLEGTARGTFEEL